MKKRILQACVFLVCAAVFGYAADDRAETALPSLMEQPGHLSGEAPMLSLESDPDFRNVLFGNVTMGAAYDSKGLSRQGANGGVVQSSDVRFFAQPGAALRQTLSKTVVTLSYSPGISFSQHNMDDRQYTHNAAGDIRWTPNKRWQLHARQDYSYSTNPFENVGRVPLLSELGGFFGPTYTGVLGTLKREQLVSNGDVSYRISQRMAVGVTGTYQLSHLGYANYIGTPPSLSNSKSFSGSAFFSDRITRRHTLGIQATYGDFYTYGLSPSRTQAPAILVFDTWQINNHSALTVFGGPQYARTSATFYLLPGLPITLRQTGTHPALGATYTWSGDRNAWSLQYSRRIGTGSGLSGTSESNYGEAGFRTRLGQRWSSELRFRVDDEKTLVTYGSDVWFRTMWAGAGVTRELTRRLSLRADGAYIKQWASGLNYAPTDHIVIQATLDFHFLKSLGR